MKKKDQSLYKILDKNAKKIKKSLYNINERNY